jgi:hypothetical protein
MSWLKKLFGRGGDHEAWLRDNPGKGPLPKAPPLVTEAEAQGMRDRMEAELDEQRERRDA